MLGQLGQFGDPHVHIEVLSFGDSFSDGFEQSDDIDNLFYPGLEQYGFINFQTIGGKAPRYRYDLVQFYSESDVAIPSGMSVTGLGVDTQNDANVTIGTECTANINLNTVLETVDNYRVFDTIRNSNAVSPVSRPGIPSQ